jgi:hypothetical protein
MFLRSWCWRYSGSGSNLTKKRFQPGRRYNPQQEQLAISIRHPAALDRKAPGRQNRLALAARPHASSLSRTDSPRASNAAGQHSSLANKGNSKMRFVLCCAIAAVALSSPAAAQETRYQQMLRANEAYRVATDVAVIYLSQHAGRLLVALLLWHNRRASGHGERQNSSVEPLGHLMHRRSVARKATVWDKAVTPVS